MRFPRNAALCLALMAVSASGQSLAGDPMTGPDPRVAIGDGAWEALTSRTGAPHDSQAREVAEELSILRMARERSTPSPRHGGVGPASLGRAAQDAVPAAPAVGETRDVPGSGLDVMVGRPAAGGPRPGDMCSLQRGGNVEVMGEDGEMGVLVRYAAPGRPGKADGTPCAHGTMAFMDAGALREWPPKGDIEAQDAAMSDKIARAADRILGTTR